MMKLLLVGLGLIGVGLGLVVFTHHNPALLFIAGIICAFIAVLHGSMPRYDRGPAVSAGDDVSSIGEGIQ